MNSQKVLTQEEEERSPWQGWQERRVSGMAASPLGLPAVTWGAFSNSSG